ncbi:MAG: SMC-Scp complex subunit ScpB [Candidatus Pelagibacterales bacterium]|jgi:segregation and condensation protein B|tara:strand:- start:51 stop:734 length:684 start_codon:yes stop_codon:yes gene_type:complete
MSKEKQTDNIMNFPSEHMDNLRVLEALLFAASEPLDAESMKARLPKGSNLNKLLSLLKAQYENRGVNLVKTGNKWSFKTAQDLSSMMKKEKIVQRKLSKAATETLSIIAYHQPVTRAEVEDIRGVHFSPGTLDVLMELNWVRPIGRKKVPGRPIIYGTTERFLEYFQLEQVSDLPGLEELKAAGLLESRLPPNLDIKEPQEVDQSQIEPFGEDENIDDLIQSGHEAE